MPDIIGERLSRIRHERGLSLRELSQRSGVAISVLSYVESGARPGSGLRLGTALKLARTLGVCLDVLAGTYEGQPATVPQPGQGKRPRKATARVAVLP